MEGDDSVKRTMATKVSVDEFGDVGEEMGGKMYRVRTVLPVGVQPGDGDGITPHSKVLSWIDGTEPSQH